MKKVKVISIVVFSLLVMLALYLYFFLPVPSFSEEELVKKIEDGKVTIEWKRTTGVLDQNFPQIITVRNGQSIDTICESHNIADLKLNEYNLIIGFYGQPVKYNNKLNLPKRILNYNVKVDTTYTK